MTIIDLKSYPFLRKIFGKTLWGYTDVCRKIDFQAGYGLYAATDLSPLRVQIPGQFQSQNLLMLRSVSMHGICPDHSAGESARYRDLSTFPEQKAVSHGNSWKSFKINSCRSQRKTRLAHICRIRPKPYRHSQRIIQRRLVSRRPERDSVCSGLNHYRFMPVGVSLGTFSKEKSCRQTPYSIGSKGQHSHIHLHFGRKTTRCQRPRSSRFGSRLILRYGSRLSGFQKTIYFQPDPCIFRYPGQSKHEIPKALFISSRKR